MVNPFKIVYSHRKILLDITKNEVKQKYAGSVMGRIWIILNPFLFLSAYFLVYIAIFKVRIEGLDTFDYVLVIFSGLIPWFGFAEAIGIGVNAVNSNSSLIKNTLFPIELIPVRIVLSSLVTQIIGLIFLIVLLSFQGNIGLYILLVPFIIFLQIIFTIGLVWLISSLCVFFRDLGQMISIILILLMLVSPIAYTVDMLGPQTLMIMKFNPLYYMITMYRDSIYYNVLPPIDVILIFSTISILLFYFGYSIFTRLKVVFTEYV